MALRKAAFARGRRLYALPPKGLADMLTVYWTTAPEIAETGAETDALAEPGKVVKIAG
jgi:hypothetical protein